MLWPVVIDVVHARRRLDSLPQMRILHEIAGGLRMSDMQAMMCACNCGNDDPDVPLNQMDGMFTFAKFEEDVGNTWNFVFVCDRCGHKVMATFIPDAENLS